jgi:hypothetical protein
MGFSIIVLVFVILGCVYLYRRKKNNTPLQQILPQKKNEMKLSIDEAYNLNKAKKEAQLNELLDKINRKGYNSLSEREKKQLKELAE